MELFTEHNDETPMAAAGYFLNTANQNLPGLPDVSKIFELSADAYYATIYAVMSEMPIKAEIARFIEKTANAADREAAVRAAFDRGDPDVHMVLRAAYKVQHEIHRLTGLLRFSPNHDGVYVARCAPDHFIIPALADHFYLRFGETPWAIIDEKRKLCLYRESGGEVQLASLAPGSVCDLSAPQLQTEGKEKADSWEDLWRLYHRSVNNEGKKNLRLQRQLMPERYHKYLNELQ